MVVLQELDGGHNINWNSITYRKGAIKRTEIEKPFLAAKACNIMLLLVTCTSALLGAKSPPCMDELLKQFSVHETFEQEIIIYENLNWMYEGCTQFSLSSWRSVAFAACFGFFFKIVLVLPFLKLCFLGYFLICWTELLC